MKDFKLYTINQTHYLINTYEIHSMQVIKNTSNDDGTLTIQSIHPLYGCFTFTGYLKEEDALAVIIKLLQDKLKNTTKELSLKIHNYKLDLKIIKANAQKKLRKKI